MENYYSRSRSKFLRISHFCNMAINFMQTISKSVIGILLTNLGLFEFKTRRLQNVEKSLPNLGTHPTSVPFQAGPKGQIALTQTDGVRVIIVQLKISRKSLYFLGAVVMCSAAIVHFKKDGLRPKIFIRLFSFSSTAIIGPRQNERLRNTC